MADLNILDRALTINEVTALQSSCTNVIEGAVVSMDTFRSKQIDGLRLILPAVCDGMFCKVCRFECIIYIHASKSIALRLFMRMK